MIVEIECVANPSGTESNRYEYIEAAIKVIQDSGLKYEVSALGTTVEGEPEQLWPLMRAVHEATLKAGSQSVVTVIKAFETAPARGEVSMQSLTGKFRS